MMLMKQKIIILGVIVLIGLVLGRLIVRLFLNFLLGGTLFGGNFLWKKGERENLCLYFFVYLYLFVH